MAFLPEHVAILGIYVLQSTSRTHPCFVDYLTVAEPDTPDIGVFFVDLDE